MNSSGLNSPGRRLAKSKMAMQTGMPEFLEPVLVGRIVEKEHNGKMVKGEVQAFTFLDAKEEAGSDIFTNSAWNIEWRNAKHPAERTREVLAGPEVREMITDRFTTASWMSPAIQHLQKAGWDEEMVDKDTSATEDAVWSALMNPSISRKAGLHAYAITCALEGGELVIPPQPGMPDHSRPENIPPVMPQKHYDTLGKAARGPNPPIAWKLNADRLTHISKRGRRLASKLASEAEALHKWRKGQMDQLAKVQKRFKQQAEANTKEKRLARKLASEAEALREWLKKQKDQLGKVQKRAVQRQRLRYLAERIPKLQAALEKWDEGDPPVFLTSPRKASKGRVLECGGEHMSQAKIAKYICEYEDELKDITAAGEVVSDNARMEEEAEVLVQADIAAQEETVELIKRLVPAAEARLREFEAAVGLTRVSTTGRGVLTARPRTMAAAKPRKPAAKRKPAAASAGASGSGKQAKTARLLPKTAIAVGPRTQAKKASPKKAKEAGAHPVALSAADDGDFMSDSDSDSDAVMGGNQPSKLESALWPGEQLVCAAGRFFPQRYVKADGDMDLDEWMEKEANEEFDTDEFYLDAIVAEKGSGANKKYIIKWKGFELNAEQWFSAKGYQECAVLDNWEDRLKVAGLM